MLETLILRSQNAIADLAKQKLNQLYYGYSCDPDALEKIKKISAYRDILQRHVAINHYNFKPCIDGDNCDGKLQCIKEHLIKLVGSGHKIKYKTVTTDISFQQEWDDAHPICRSYEIWEKWSRVIARNYDLDISITKMEENLVVELIKNSIPNELIVNLTLVKQANDMQVTLIKNIEEEVLKYNTSILYDNSELNLDTFVSLVENNISFDIIKTVYESGLSFEITKTEQSSTVNLVTSLCKYDINELNVNLQVLRDLST
jgi:hypothetical protein